jgi:hypothetical protein
VERITEERAVKKLFKNIREGRRTLGKPRKRWLDDVENYLKKLGVKAGDKQLGTERLLEIDPEERQGPSCIVQPVQKR